MESTSEAAKNAVLHEAQNGSGPWHYITRSSKRFSTANIASLAETANIGSLNETAKALVGTECPLSAGNVACTNCR